MTNTDLVVAISDRSTDGLDLLFNSPAGKRLLVERGVSPDIVEALVDFGYSSIANALGSIAAAKKWGLTGDDVVVSVATDGSELYDAEREQFIARNYPGGFDDVEADKVFIDHLENVSTEHTLDMDETNRNRVFNLGYYTWVEQQGISIPDFERRRSQDFWDGLRPIVDRWDEMIDDFNA